MRDFTSDLGPIQYFFPLVIVLTNVLVLYELWAWATEYVGWIRARYGYWPTISELTYHHTWLGWLIAVAIALFEAWWLTHMRTLR